MSAQSSRPVNPSHSVERLLDKGHAYYQIGDLSSAAAEYKAILALKPNHFDALRMLGLIAYQRQEYANAIEFLKKASAIRKKPETLFFLGCSLQSRGLLKEAMASYHRVLKLKPNHVDAHNNLGIIFHTLGADNKATTHFKRALTFNPQHATVHNNFGLTLLAQRRMDEAVASFDRAISVKPDYVDAHLNRGVALQARGRLDEALASYRRALTLKPDLALPYLYYLQCKRIAPDDAVLLERLEHLAVRADPDPENKANACFALGKGYDGLGQHARAFSCFSKANQLERAKYNFDRERFADEITALIETFSREFFAQREAYGDTSDETPILIIGMPRSGTTLIEQILSSHSAVAGAGELAFWQKQREQTSPRDITREDALAIAVQYRTHLRALFPEAARVIDKMPQNFFNLGLVRLCLPSARIVHCKRNPLDTCLSLYFEKFVQPHPYAYDLEDIAFYYEQYERLMRHWGSVLSGQLLEVQYEELVTDLAATTRRMLEFCGLEWEEQCLHFEHNRRPVLTASNWQVRQPLYSSSVGRWRNYRQFLGPLARLSDPDSNPPE